MRDFVWMSAHLGGLSNATHVVLGWEPPADTGLPLLGYRFLIDAGTPRAEVVDVSCPCGTQYNDLATEPVVVDDVWCLRAGLPGTVDLPSLDEIPSPVVSGSTPGPPPT